MVIEYMNIFSKVMKWGSDTDTTVSIAIIIAVVVLLIVFLLRDRLIELSVDGKMAKMQAKMETKSNDSEFQETRSVSVSFRNSKLRGEGEYILKNTDFSNLDIDGKQRIKSGYDEPSVDVKDDNED